MERARLLGSCAALAVLLSVLPQTSRGEWELSRAGADVPALYAVCSPDGTRVCAVGADAGGSCVLRSDDRGETWSADSLSGDPYGLRAVAFRDSLVGCAGGLRLYRTVDGGQSWTSVTNPVPQVVEDVHWITSERVCGVGHAGTVLLSADAAQSWTPVDIGTDGSLYAVDFVSDTVGWVAGYEGLFHTEDGGWTWTDVTPAEGVGTAFYGLDFADAECGWAVGANQSVLRTTDGGVSWQLLYTGQSGLDLLDVCSLGTACVRACGRNGTVLCSRNNGIDWVLESTPVAAARHLTGLAFSGTELGWCVGESSGGMPGVVLRYREPASVRGLVRLEGRLVHGAAVVEAFLDGALIATAPVAADGSFRFAAIPPGTEYLFRASCTGYLAAEHESGDLASGQVLTLLPVVLPAGDVDGDNDIDGADLEAVVAAHHQSSGWGGDLNGDGLVDVRDSVLIAGNLGSAGAVVWPTRPGTDWIRNGELELITERDATDAAGRFAPDAVVLDDGSLRLYYTADDGEVWRICSLRSADGITWEREPGVRLEAGDGYADVYSPQVIRTASGAWRMYYTARTHEPLTADILTAVSVDGLAWTGAGMCIQHGGEFDSRTAECPSLFRDEDGSAHVFPDGTLRMVYTGSNGQESRILTATSLDGVNWTRGESVTELEPGVSDSHPHDPMACLLEDGSIQIAVGGLSGLIGFWSADGATWEPVGGLLSKGLRGEVDGSGIGAGSQVQVGNLALLFGTGFADDGSVTLLSFRQRQASDDLTDPDVFTRIGTERVSVAQVRLTADYALPPTLVPGGDLTYTVTAAVLLDRGRLADFVVPLVDLTESTGTVELLIEYMGDEPVESEAIELILGRRASGSFLGGGLLWRARVPGLLADLPQAFPMGLSAAYLQSHRGVWPAARENEDDLAFGSLMSQVFPLPLSWRPGSSGSVTCTRAAELRAGQTVPVHGGPYLELTPACRYMNVWGHRATLTAEVLGPDAAGAFTLPLTDQFRVHELALDPTVAAPEQHTRASPDEQAPTLQTVARTLRIDYLGTEPIPESRVRVVIRDKERVLDESVVMVAEEDDSLVPYAKSWAPLGALTVQETVWEAMSADATRVSFTYSLSLLPGAALLPNASLRVEQSLRREEIAADDDRLFATEVVPLAAGSQCSASLQVRYVGDEESVRTDGLVLRCVVDPGAVLVEADLGGGREWSPQARGFCSFAGNAPVVEPVERGSSLKLRLAAGLWAASGGDGVLVPRVLRNGVELPGFLADGGQVPCAASLDAYQNGGVDQDSIRTLTVTYAGDETELWSDSVEVVLVHPMTGPTPLATTGPTAFGKVWTPAPQGSVRSVAIEPDDTGWGAAISVVCDYASRTVPTASLVASWYELVPAAADGVTFLEERVVRSFVFDEASVTQGTSREVRLGSHYVGSGQGRTDGLRVTLVAGNGQVVDQYRQSDPERTWIPGPGNRLEVESVSAIDEEGLQLDVTASVELAGVEAGHEYTLEVRAQDTRTGSACNDVLGELVLADPAGFVGGPVCVSVPTHFIGSDYLRRTEALRVSLRDNGTTMFDPAGRPLRLVFPYSMVWNNGIPGQITHPVVVPISPCEVAFHCEYEFYEETQGMRPLVRLLQGDEVVTGTEDNLFEIVLTPGFDVPPEGSAGAVFGRIRYTGDEFLLHTDTLEVALISEARSRAVHTPLLSISVAFSKDWSVYDDVVHSSEYSLALAGTQLAACNRLIARVDYACPDDYVGYRGENGLLLKAFLWTGLTPLFQPPAEIAALIEDSGDASALDDWRDLAFDSRELEIGRPVSPNTNQTAIDQLNEGWEPAVDVQEISQVLFPPFLRARPGVVIVPAEGQHDFELDFTPVEGDITVNAVTLVFYRRNGDPVYSQTFPLPEDVQYIHAPNALAPVLKDEPVFSVETDAIRCHGEMTISMGYVKNDADVEGTEVGLAPFTTGTPTNPYYPLELVEVLHVGDSASAADWVPGEPAVVQAVVGHGLVRYRFRLADFQLRESIDEILVFSMGTAGHEDDRFEYRFNYNWIQCARVRPDDTGFVSQPRGNRIEFGPLHLIFDPSLCESPVVLTATPLASSGPLPGLTVTPVELSFNEAEDGREVAVTCRQPVVTEFDWSDVEESVQTADRVVLAVMGAGGSQGVLGQWVLELEEPLVWERAPVLASLGAEGFAPLASPPGLAVFGTWTTADAGVAELLATLEPNEFIGMRCEALINGHPVADPIESDVQELQLRPDASATRRSCLFFESGTVAGITTNEIGIYVGVFHRDPDLGLIQTGRLGRTEVDYVTQWPNINSFIVATLYALEIFDDGDTLLGSGEDMLSVFGFTGSEVDPQTLATALQNGHGETRWPVELGKNARWRETDAPDTWETKLPFFTKREYEMRSDLALAFHLMDDDSLPAALMALKSKLLQIGAAVATAFGQTYIATALNLVDSLTTKFAQYVGMSDEIELGAVILPQEPLHWGLGAAPDSFADVMYLKHGGKATPTLGVDRQIISPEPSPLIVRFKELEVIHDGDTGLYGRGEVFCKCRVLDGITESEVRFPESGHRSMDNGDRYLIPESDQVVFRTDAVGPVLYVEIAVWEEDDPDWGNDHDNLGNLTWLELPHGEGWSVPLVLEGTDSNEGKFRAVFEVREPGG